MGKREEDIRNVVVHGDCIEMMKLVPDESIHLTFTSPPYYNAKSYSQYNSYEEYLDHLVEVSKEVHRITKEGRFYIVNTSIVNDFVSRSKNTIRYTIPYDLNSLLVKDGWDFWETIIWAKREPSVKFRGGSFSQGGKPLLYYANNRTEYVIVYRKHTDKIIRRIARKYPKDIIEQSKVTDYISGDIWEIPNASSIRHEAIFPDELAKQIIQLYSYKTDIVFDPYGGSGTTGRVASLMDRSFLMAEQHIYYINVMQQLMNQFETTFLTLEDFKKRL